MPFDKDMERDGFSTITESLTDKARTGARFSSEEGEENQRMVELIYRLYDISLRDEFCLDRLMDEVRKYEETDEVVKIETEPKEDNYSEPEEKPKVSSNKREKGKSTHKKKKNQMKMNLDYLKKIMTTMISSVHLMMMKTEMKYQDLFQN